MRTIGSLALAAAMTCTTSFAQSLPGEAAAIPDSIPGVIDAAARWELVWSDVASADGIVGDETGVWHRGKISSS